MCLKYSKTISNSLSRTEKDLNFRVFVAKCEADFKREPLDSLVYMDRLAPRNNNFEYYQAAVHSCNDVPDGEPLLLLPVYKSFAQHNGDRLFWIFASLAIGSAVFLLILLCYQIKGNSAVKKRTARREVKKAP